MPIGGKAGAGLGVEELSQRATLGHEVGWSSAVLPHPHPSPFPSAALLLGRLSLAPGLPFSPAPGNLGPVWIFPTTIWIQTPA